MNALSTARFSSVRLGGIPPAAATRSLTATAAPDSVTLSASLLGPDTRRAVLDIYEGREVAVDSSVVRQVRKSLEAMARIRSDTAVINVSFVADCLRPGEKFPRVSEAFESLLVAADGMYSANVRQAFTHIRASRSPVETEKQFRVLLHGCRQDASRAWPHLQTLETFASRFGDATKAATTCASILRIARAAADPLLPAALSQVCLAAEPQAELECLRDLVAAGGRLDEAISDLSLLRSGSWQAVDLGERKQVLMALREAGVSGATETARALDLVLQGRDADERKARLSELRRLEKVEDDASRAREDLEWIVSDMAPSDNVHVATGRFLRLLDPATPSERPLVRELYRAVQAGVREVPQAWLPRILGLAHPAEHAVEIVRRLEPSTPRVVDHMKVVQQGSRPGEALDDAAVRLRALLLMPETESAIVGHQAFLEVARPLAASDPGDEARWKRFRSLATETRSVHDATFIWKTAAVATDASEQGRRLAAWHRLLAQEEGRPADATRLFAAASQGLAPDAAMDPAIEVITEMRRTMTLDTAVATYKYTVTWGAQSGNASPTREEQTRFFAAIFAQAATERIPTAELVRRIEAPVPGTTLFERASILRSLLTTDRTAAKALAEYDWIVAALPGLGAESAARVGDALALLAAATPASESSRNLLSWLLEQRKALPALAAEPLDVQLGSLASTLLLAPDVEAAKARLILEKTRPAAGTVEMGEQEIIIGGIRIKKNISAETAAPPPDSPLPASPESKE